MTTINSLSPAYTANVMRADEPKPGNPAFRGDNNEMVEAVNKNSRSVNTAATAALVTSVATLIPLTILAIKTHQLNNTTKEIKEKAVPMMDNIKPLLEKSNGVASDVKTMTGSVKNTVTDISESVRAFWDKVVKFVKNMSPNAGEEAAEAAEAAEGAEGGLGNLLNSVISMFGKTPGEGGEGATALKDGLGGLFTVVRSMMGNVNGEVIKEEIGKLNLETMPENVRPLVEKIKSKFEQMSPEEIESKGADILKELKADFPQLNVEEIPEEVKNIIKRIFTGGIL